MSSSEFTRMPVNTAFPEAYGSEEESGMMEALEGGAFVEPYDFVGSFARYIPDELRGADAQAYVSRFITNGFKLYPGGASQATDLTIFERATAEYPTVKQLVAGTRASEQLLVKMVEQYTIRRSAISEDWAEVRLQRRVVDGHGNRKGLHDNFGLPIGSTATTTNPVFTRGMNMFLASRSFMTGAGHVRSSKLDYAQKVNGLTRVNSYVMGGSMYRFVNTDGSPRFETRSNDINISDWATQMRVGSTGLMMTVLHTPLESEVVKLHASSAILTAKRANRLALGNDYGIDAVPDVMTGVDFIQQLAEMSLDKLQLYVEDLPTEHFLIAKDMLAFCEDYKRVIAGEDHIGLLADRADWAAKFCDILKWLHRDQAVGIRRDLHDTKSKARDMLYDHISVAAVAGELQPTRYGTGYKLRNRGFFRPVVTDIDIASAYRHAPKGTRAHLRAQLIKEYDVHDIDWHYVEIEDREQRAKIELTDVLKTGFSARDEMLMQQIKARSGKR